MEMLVTISTNIIRTIPKRSFLKDAVRGFVLIVVLPATMPADLVTVRLLDQDAVEHTLGQICVSAAGCTVSGGTLDLTIGVTHTFALVPSASNSSRVSRCSTQRFCIASTRVWCWWVTMASSPETGRLS